jgi:hypothetical protein
LPICGVRRKRRQSGNLRRRNPVTRHELRKAPPVKSTAAHTKARARKTEDGEPAHSFRTLLADLATLTRNKMRFGHALPMTVLSRPTPIQQRAFDLLGVALAP